jgi:hypothetical protein
MRVRSNQRCWVGVTIRETNNRIGWVFVTKYMRAGEDEPVAKVHTAASRAAATDDHHRGKLGCGSVAEQYEK